MQQKKPKELAPLMTAIEQVLRELGEAKSVAPRLTKKLQKLFDEYATCCFFAQVVPGKEDLKGKKDPKRKKDPKSKNHPKGKKDPKGSPTRSAV
jgi:hypothetical protein